jgi:hypothetical protein
MNGIVRTAGARNTESSTVVDAGHPRILPRFTFPMNAIAPAAGAEDT